MVATSFLKYATVLSLAPSVFSKPVRRDVPVAVVSQSSQDSFQSFDNFGGISSLSNFDQFFGSSNFDGSSNQQTIIIEQQQRVCSNVEIQFIQQRLTIMREFVKRVLLEQVCDVETQVVVLSQFSSGLDSFGRDIRRKSGRDVSFDASISSQLAQLLDQNGDLSIGDLGFLGSSVGSNSIIVSGSNWIDSSSPISVGSVYNAAMSARGASQNVNATEPASTKTASAESETATSSSESSTESESSTTSSAEATATNESSD